MSLIDSLRNLLRRYPGEWFYIATSEIPSGADNLLARLGTEGWEVKREPRLGMRIAVFARWAGTE